MKFSIALLSFAALALGQVTRGPDTDPNSLIATATETYDHEGPTEASAPSTSASVEQWPQYSKASTTATPSEGPSSAQPDSPFTFGDGASGSPSATGTWNSWSGSTTATPSVWTTSVKSSAKSTSAAALTTSAAATTHATAYSTTAKASSSTKASSSAQAAYTGAAVVAKEVALGFGAVAAGLALVF